MSSDPYRLFSKNEWDQRSLQKIFQLLRCIVPLQKSIFFSIIWNNEYRYSLSQIILSVLSVDTNLFVTWWSDLFLNFSKLNCDSEAEIGSSVSNAYRKEHFVIIIQIILQEWNHFNIFCIRSLRMNIIRFYFSYLWKKHFKLGNVKVYFPSYLSFGVIEVEFFSNLVRDYPIQ